MMSLLTSSDGFLTDKLLIATHSIQDGCFDKTLIYICAHNKDGALGLIVNMPLTGLDAKALMEEVNIKPIRQLPSYSVYFGGPVDTNQGFILHSDETTHKTTLVNPSGIAFSTGIHMLEDIATGTGPRQLLIALGCSGWASGQLEKELEEGSWLIAPATPELLFTTRDEDKWQQAASSLGVDLDRLSSDVGHA